MRFRVGEHLPAIESALEIGPVDLLQERMLGDDFDSGKIAEGRLQAVAQLAAHLILKDRGQEAGFGDMEKQLEVIGFSALGIECSPGSCWPKYRNSQGAEENS